MRALTTPRGVYLNVSIVSRSEARVATRDHRDKYGDAVLKLGWPVYEPRRRLGHRRGPCRDSPDRRHRVRAIAVQGGRRLLLRRNRDCGALDVARFEIRSINGSRKADPSIPAR